MKESLMDEVATHVLVPVNVAEKLRELARKTRVRQSEYLREAVIDLLSKYQSTVPQTEARADGGEHADG